MKKLLVVTLIASSLLIGCETTEVDTGEVISANVEVDKEMEEAKPVKEIVFTTTNSATEVVSKEDEASSKSFELTFDKVETSSEVSDSDVNEEETYNEAFDSNLSEEEIYEILSKAIDAVEGQGISISIKHDAIDYEEDGIKVKMDASDSTMYIDANNSCLLYTSPSPRD